MPASAKSPDPTLLWCTGCEQPLAPDSFWPDTNAGEARTDLDGIKRSTRCKTCRNQEYIRIDPRRKLLYNARNRAKDRGLECNLIVEDIEIPEICPVLGIPIFASIGKGRVSMKDNWNAPTLDRIDPAGGYTRGNVKVISARANFLKNDASLDELEAIYLYMKGNLRQTS
jgi:hypothetical protein